MAYYSVLIADSSEEFRLALQAQLENFCAVTLCASAGEALDYLRQEPVDVLVVDLMLPGMDGFSLVEAVAGSGRRPGILAVSAYLSPFILETAENLGIRRILGKPCDMEKLGDRVLELLREESSEQQARISSVLLNLGFCAKYRGYAYLREAVARMIENPNRAMVKELYRQVGESFGTTGRLTERDIRCAIQEAWAVGNRNVWNRCLGQKIEKKPTSAALIRRLSRILSGEAGLKKAAGGEK